MKLLIINWQDRLNPQAGGAEIHLHEIFGRLAARGHEVTLLASSWPGAPARDVVDGIAVHRTGSRYTFSRAAPSYYRRVLAAEPYDFVIEDLNKVPLFSPLWVRQPLVLLVHHLFGITAFQEAAFPVAAATWLLERPLARFYRGLPVQAVSESTAADLVDRGLRAEDIRVIYNGVDTGFYTPASSTSRFAEPTFAYVGRLRRYKRVDLILEAVARLSHRGIGARLIIAGRGDHAGALHSLARRLGIEAQVEFAGFISDEAKRDLLRSAWANVLTSPKEGWGITNLEAAACGTPTVASDAPGLRESVVHGRTGCLVPHGDVEALAQVLGRLATDREQVEVLGAEARRFAEMFTWDRSASATEDHLLQLTATAMQPA